MKSLDFTRSDRLQDQIKREVSQILNKQVKDPRLYGLTLTRAELTPDKKKAFIYFSSLNSFNDATPEDVEIGFLKAKGFIRSALSANLSLKFTPDLVFLSENDLTSQY